LAIVVIDAFTSRAFSGNQAAVCVLESASSLSAAQMQQIAAEMNLSETAFVHAIDATAGTYHLRWFTPQVEVNLCGHATLATAWALFSERHVQPRCLRFQTLSGELTVERDDADANVLRMDFPLGASALVQLPDATLTALRAALWPATSASRQCAIAAVYFCPKTKKLLVEVDSETHVHAVALSPAELVAVFPPGSATSTGLPDVRGVAVTTSNVAAGADYRICSRYFAPWVGLNEDPVTGSAHTALAAMYAPRLGHTFRARQASQRNGFMTVSIDPARVPAGRVWLSGQAVTVLRGALDLSTAARS
jgi:PhzF family phenazine biosynthesis protein